MSYTQLLYHVVLRTHKSERTINEKHERELYRYVGDLKTSTSKWLKANPNFWLFDGWSKEYAGFSYAFRDKDLIVNYIMRQKEHHRIKTFAEEYREFLMENGIKLDERYYLQDG